MDRITYEEWKSRYAGSAPSEDNEIPLTYLLEWRLNHGLSVKALADAMGVSRYALAQIEAGKRPMTMAFATKAAKVLSCTIEDLFRSPS